MADVKISGLPASTTPLTGTEILPIVQGGVTKQNSVANLTAGRAISATELTLTTGNLIVANGQGIDFSATPGTGTSELLNDYEKGTWSPVVTSTVGTLSGVNATGTYTKIGREVYITYNILITANGTGAGAIRIDDLPFTLAQRGFGVGVESDVIGFGIYTNAIAATTFALVSRFTQTYPGGTSHRLQGDCSYIT